jgi:hypothetical protein
MKHILLIFALTSLFAVKAQDCLINDKVDVFLSDTASFERGEGVDSIPLNAPVYFRVPLYDVNCLAVEFKIRYNGNLISLGELHDGVQLEDNGDNTGVWKYELLNGFNTVGEFEIDFYPGNKYKSITVYDPILGVEDELKENKIVETRVFTSSGVEVDVYEGEFDLSRLNKGFFIYISTLSNGETLRGKVFN